MNPIIHQLTRICKENLLSEKWLIVSSLRVGHQWLDQVARNGQPVVNMRLQTVSRMAFEWIEMDSGVDSAKMLASLAGPLILQNIWRNAAKGELKYLNDLSPNLKLFQKLYETIESLRLANLSSGEICNNHFECHEKGDDIAYLLGQYERYLERNQLLDRAELLKKAVLMVSSNRDDTIPSDSIFIVPDTLELSHLENEFLRYLTQNQCITLPSASILERTEEPASDLDLLRWLPAPVEAPAAFQDESVRIFSALGEINEIREVLRRCLADEIPLDTVELLYTDVHTYLPQIYETGLSVLPLDPQNSIPITFADGIPVRYSRPGRLLHIWLEWRQSDYPQTLLLQMLEDGLLNHPLFDNGSVQADSCIQSLRSIAIGSKRERYESRIQQTIQSLERQVKDSFSPHESQEIEGTEYQQKLRQEIELFKILYTIVSDWFSILPPLHANPLEQIDSIHALLADYSHNSTELDRNARNRIMDELETMGSCIQEHEENNEIDIQEWLSSLPTQLRVLGSSPREGRLHAASITNGGNSGRTVTFIVGLDDARFPGSVFQDPFLLDRERETMSSALPTASTHQRDTLDRFYQLLGRLQGQLTLSYSSYDLSDDREMFPSSVVLNAYRILSENREGDPSSLAEWLFPPASFSPLDSRKALNESELWMHRMNGQKCGHNSLADAMRRYPHIGNGLTAQAARCSQDYTEYDGWVPESGKDLDPTLPHGIVMSASRFETLGQCPLRFFFENGLKLQPLDDIGVDPDRWLDPLQFGSFLHEMFETFMQELIDKKEKPNYKNHWPRLKNLLGELVQKYRDYILPPNESAFTRQRLEFEQCAVIFLKDEETLCQSHTPVYVEAALGIPSPKSSKTVSTTPLHILLPDGKSFRARGIIDRVDRIGNESEHMYAIWDYKSGGTYKYEQNDPFRQGRVIQHSLYYELMTLWLRDCVSPHATISQFGYFFPSEKGKGERIAWTEPELAERGNMFQSLCQSIAHGIFAPTNDEKDCNFCDFQPICQDVASITRSSDKKLRNPMNVWLQPLKELRCDER